MNDPLNYVIAAFGRACLVQICSESQCFAHLGNVPHPYLIVDMDHHSLGLQRQGQSRCDFIVFHEKQGGVEAIALELKSGRVRMTDVQNQLNASSQFLETSLPSSILKGFVPVLFHKQKISTQFSRNLNEAKVRFRGDYMTIRQRRCNNPNTPLFPI